MAFSYAALRSWMFNISPAPAALAKRASKAFSSAKVMFWRLRPPLGLDLSAASPPPSYAICARFTVLSDTPIAAAIEGCVIPLSRSSTIEMRWRRMGSPFQYSAVFNRRTWPLLHFTICSLRIRWSKRITPRVEVESPSQVRLPAPPKFRFNQLWKRYKHCNEAFLEIISEHRERLPNLRYTGLCNR